MQPLRSGCCGWVANWQIWHESPPWCSLVQIGRQDSFHLMRDLLLLAIHLLVTLTKFLGPGGARQVVAESLLLKHQLLISNRSRQRAPNLTMLDRLLLGLTTLFVSPTSHFKTICGYQAGHPIQVSRV